MMKSLLGAAAGALIFGAGAASAERYVDYVPQPGVWQITAVEVDPNHVDEYLAGLRKSQLPSMEVLKKRGLVDAYKVVVRTGYVKGSPNVLIMTHAPSFATFDPDKARDQAVSKEIYSIFSKDKEKTAVAGYEKIRTFVDDALWTDVTLLP